MSAHGPVTMPRDVILIQALCKLTSCSASRRTCEEHSSCSDLDSAAHTIPQTAGDQSERAQRRHLHRHIRAHAVPNAAISLPIVITGKQAQPMLRIVRRQVSHAQVRPQGAVRPISVGLELFQTSRSFFPPFLVKVNVGPLP